MDHEFPDVVELNVGGVHYQTLLTTLISQEGSELAKMFTGRVPVYKDGNGQFFLDADGKTFKYILEFLRYNSIKDIGLRPDFSSGAGFGSSFGPRENALDLRLLHREAVHFRLNKLVQALEEFRPIFIRSKVDEYRKSVPNFDEVIKKILNAIGAENMFGYDQTAVLIAQDYQGGEMPCCDHVCREDVRNRFGSYTEQRAVDVVRVPFKMTVPLFKCLCESLISLGYNAHGRVSKCGFVCKKQYSTGGFITFDNQQNHCCQETLFTVQFTWNATGLFGFHQGAQPTFGFGTPGATTGFGQAHAVKADGGTFSFGAAPQQSAFGNSSSTGFSFGSVQPRGGLFGSSNPQESPNKPAGLFGSSQNSQANQGSFFGTKSPEVGGVGFGGQSGGGLFGKPNVTQPQGLFGGAKTSQAKKSFSFGTQNPATTASFQNPQQPIFGPAGGFGKAPSAFSGEKKLAGSGFSFGQPRFGNIGQSHAFGGPPAFSGMTNINSGFVKTDKNNGTFGMPSKNATGFTFGQQEIRNQATETPEKTHPSTEPANETVNGPPLKNPDEKTGAFTEVTGSGPESPDEDEDEEETSQVSSKFGFVTDIPSEGFGLKCQRFVDK